MTNRLLTAMWFLSLLAGCAGAPVVDAAAPDPVATAQRAWLAGRPANYRFIWQQTCFCLPAAVQPIRITVHGEAIADATDSNGKAVSADVASGLMTIDALYAYALAQRRAGAEVQVVHDPRGIPQQVFIDPNPHVSDDELRVTVSGFEALP